jgi:molecular chaperone GrpE (heat shock protein)
MSDPPARQAGSPPLDLSLDADALKVDLFAADKRPARSDAGVMEEIADDLLELMKRMGQLESRLAAVAATVDALQQQAGASAHVQGVEIEKLKEALLSDRKEYIGRSTFNVVRPAFESLQDLKGGYEKQQADPEQIRHTQSLIDVLGGVIQMLGYQAFAPDPGQDFDPQTMECAGHADGVPGKIVRVERPGYRAGSVLVRPCAVVLGRETESEA